MASQLMNLCKRMLSIGEGSRNLRSSARQRKQHGPAVIEVLEERRLLTADMWEPVELSDDAAAFFDDSYVHEIHITFADEDWFDVLVESHTNDADDPYFEASFVGDGIEMGSIGVRFKGNSSFDGTGVKKSFKLDFNEYEQDDEDLSFLGLTKLNLNNNFNDPSMLREKLFYDYASNFVEGVSRAVHTKLYVNGEYYGLYTAVEQVDKNLAQSRFGSDEDGNLYKGSASDDVADDPSADFGSDLTYLGTDQADYEDFYQLKTNETANDYSQLIELLDVLNNTSSTDLSAAIEPLLDVQDTLASLALNNLFVNLDSYSGAAHNYYLYDRDDTGQFTHLFWDVNESFGTFTQFTERGSDPLELDPFWLPTAQGPPGQAEPELRPLAENLWEVDEYSTAYLQDLAEMLREGFDVTSASARITELADLIRDDVTADPNKQYTAAQFELNLTSDVSDGMRTIYGLTNFIEERSAFLQSTLDTYADQTNLAFNEVMSVNVSTNPDQSGDFDPWVEIYNNGPGLVSMTGTYLTNDADDLTKWAIPTSDLDDGQFLTLWLDGETAEGANHASFALDSDGGSLLLTDGTAVIDTLTYGVLEEDTSFARIPDGVGEFEVTNQPTFGIENEPSAIETVEIYINELMADNDATIEDPDDAGSFEDWIELYNPGSKSVDLSGFYLTDDASDPTLWQFPSGSVIAAGGFLLIWADKDTDQGDDHADFKLSSGGEVVQLYNIDGTTLVDSVTFGEQTTDISYGRTPDGTDTLSLMATPTPGTSNVDSALRTISIANASLVTEGNDLIFEITIDQDPTSSVSVLLTTSDGTAIGGSDYTAILEQSITFEPGGSLTKSVSVTTINDTEQDSAVQETVFVNLSDATGATLTNSQAVGYIADDERLTKPVVDDIARYPDTDSPTITWQTVSGAASYNVWLTRRFPAATRVLSEESSVTSEQFTPSSDLDPGYYKVWVQAIDSDNVGGTWSDVQTFEIRPELGTPTIATFTSPPTFTWTTIPNAPGYELFIRTTDGDTVVNNIATNSYTPSEALTQSEGRWWIRSSDAIGNRGWSLAGKFGPATEIESPVGTQNSATPTFAWVDTQGAGRYVLHVANLDTSTVQIREDNLTTNSYTPSTALPSGSYRAWVKAIDSATDSFAAGVWSDPIDFSIASAGVFNEVDIQTPFKTILSVLPLKALPESSEPFVDNQPTPAAEASQKEASENGIGETKLPVQRSTDNQSNNELLDLCMKEFSQLITNLDT